MSERTSKRKLETVAAVLGERDVNILLTLRQCRYMTTHHLRRLFFADAITPVAALRSANRGLVRLRDLGLTSTLERRIGGIRAGSGSYVWRLTPAGHRLLCLIQKNEDEHIRKHNFEPSRTFLEHTLAVAEVYVFFRELVMAGKISVCSVLNEPDCWRQYAASGGVAATLKPDLSAITSAGEYEDHWFLEIDRDTESPSVIIRKCKQYLAYQRSGTEQRRHGVFPYVIWIVPDGKRRDSINNYMQKEFSSGAADLFRVVILDELGSLIISGAEQFGGGA